MDEQILEHLKQTIRYIFPMTDEDMAYLIEVEIKVVQLKKMDLC